MTEVVEGDHGLIGHDNPLMAGFDYTHSDLDRLDQRYGRGLAKRCANVVALLCHAQLELGSWVTQRDAELWLDATDDNYDDAVALIASGQIDHSTPAVSAICPNGASGRCRCSLHHPGLLEYASDRAGYQAFLDRLEPEPPPPGVTSARSLLRLKKLGFVDQAYRLHVGNCAGCKLSRASRTHMEACRDPDRPTVEAFVTWLTDQAIDIARAEDKAKRPRRKKATVRRLPQGQSRVDPAMKVRFVDPAAGDPRKAA